MKKIIILIVLSLLLAGCTEEKGYIEKMDDSYNGTLEIEDDLNLTGDLTFEPGNFSLGWEINTSTPFIIVDCDWLLNDTLVTWDNLNLSLTKGNKSTEIDMRKLCEE